MGPHLINRRSAACGSRVCARSDGAFRIALWTCVALLAALPACTSKGTAPGAGMRGKRPPAPVAVAQTTQRTVPVQVPTIGTVEAVSSVQVRSQVTGQLEAVHFTEGQYVKKGAVLFTLDRRPFVAALRQAQANLARDQAQLANAKVETLRAKVAADQGIDNLQNYDARRTAQQVLEATIQADNAAIETAKLNVSYCTITSPLDGRTGAYMSYPGDQVKANDTPYLVSIMQITPIYVTFSVAAKYLGEIRKHRAQGDATVVATLADDTGARFTGKIAFIDNTVDKSTGQIRIKGLFDNPDHRLWPGQYARVVLNLGVRRDVTTAPSSAILVGQQGEYVYVVKPDKTVEARVVKTGDTVDENTIIEEGLKPGETVVTNGQVRLAPGVAVQITAPQKPAASGAARAKS